MFLAMATCNAQSKSEVLNYIKGCGIKHPEIVMKQCLLETRHLTSRRCVEDHNLFAMKMPKQRPSLSCGQSSERYCVFASWQQSIRDYALYQMMYYKGGDYYEFLSRGNYAESKQYINKLKSIIL
jgi:uncharacterized FlgJ-related protein